MTNLFKSALICIVFFAFNNINAQTEYTVNQLESFSMVYNLIAENSDQFKPDHNKVLKETGISQERYKELLELSNSQNLLQLTPDEQILFDAIRNEHHRVIELRESTIRNLCEVNNISTTTYYTLMLKYKTDKEYKSVIQPYLDKVKAKN